MNHEFKKLFVNGEGNVYFDSSSTSIKPKRVREVFANNLHYTNLGRSSYKDAVLTETAFEEAIQIIKSYFNITEEFELIITSGATESINIVANCFLPQNLTNKYVIGSPIEHHSNYLTWKMICKERNGIYVTADYDIKSGSFNTETLTENQLNQTVMAAISYTSNVLGNVTGIETFIKTMKQHNINVLIDAAQTVSHMQIDIKKINADFVVFSAHKMFGPFGVGALVVKKDCLNKMKPWKYGGGMVLNVNEMKWKSGADRYYAGTMNPPAVIAWGEAIRFIEEFSMKSFHEHTFRLTKKLYEGLLNERNIKIYTGDINNNLGIISFSYDSVHVHDMGEYFNSNGFSVGVGHHCAQPLMNYLGVTALIRISLNAYNTMDEIERFISCVHEI